MKILAAVVVLVLAGSPAFAQPSLTEPAPPSEVELKDPATATTLSVVGALVPVGLAIAASTAESSDVSAVLAWGGVLSSVVGPSLGHWYSGNFLTGGMAMRGIGGAAFVGGAMMAFGDCFLKENCDSSGAEIVMVLGGLTYAGGVIYDIATAGEAARTYNREHQPRRMVQVTPTMVGAHAAPGIGLVGTF